MADMISISASWWSYPVGFSVLSAMDEGGPLATRSAAARQARGLALSMKILSAS
jgi:hypothetical protein